MTQHNGPQDPTQWNGPQQPWSGQPPQAGGPFPPVPPGPTPTKKNWFARHKILTGLFGLIAVIVIGSAAAAGGTSGDSTDASSAPAATSAPANDTPAADGETAQPVQPAQQTQPVQKTRTASKAAKKTTTKAAPQKADNEPHIGTPVTSGDLQFTVTKVERGLSSVGDGFMAEKAQGSYTLVHVTVRNVGDDSETFFDDDQKIKDADNKTYSPDSAAEISIENNDVWLSDINPGNAVDGVLVYDMPVGVKATAIEFSGGLFDDAKTVQLR